MEAEGTLKPTPLGAIRPKRFVVEVEGVTDADGQPLRIMVQSMRSHDVLRILGGLPEGVPALEAGPQNAPTLKDVVDDYSEWETVAMQLVELAVVEPRFSFNVDGPVEGCADWGVLTAVEQLAIVKTILQVAGLSSGRSAALRTFLVANREGRPGGADAGTPVEVAGPADA
jgi:hypothetical protein